MRAAIPLCALALLASCSPAPAQEAGPRYDRRWVWIMSNLLVDKEADRVVALVERAGRDGYNGVFDPNHNAVKDDFLVNGTFEGSWDGLQSSVVIANWNGGKAKASLDFFAKRGHPQVIAGYYDSDDNWKTWDAAARGVPGVIGFMYTTWQNRYDDLERYGRALIEAK